MLFWGSRRSAFRVKAFKHMGLYIWCSGFRDVGIKALEMYI